MLPDTSVSRYGWKMIIQKASVSCVRSTDVVFYVHEINLIGDEIHPKGSICIMIPPGYAKSLKLLENIFRNHS